MKQPLFIQIDFKSEPAMRNHTVLHMPVYLLGRFFIFFPLKTDSPGIVRQIFCSKEKIFSFSSFSLPFIFVFLIFIHFYSPFKQCSGLYWRKEKGRGRGCANLLFPLLYFQYNFFPTQKHFHTIQCLPQFKKKRTYESK